MLPDKVVTLIVDAALVLAAIAVLYFGGSGLLNMIQAPAKLDSAIGDNHALAEATKAQGEGIKAAAEEGKRRKAASQKAVEAAGKADYEAAQAILGSKAPGATPIERINNRIDAELGLK